MKTDQKKALLYALGAVLAWSTVSTAFKLSLKEFTPLGLLLFSSIFATLFLLLVNLIKYGKDAFRQDSQSWKRSLLAGLLNPFFYYLILFIAYSRLRAQEAQVLNYTWAIVLSLLSVILLKERFRVKDLFALCLSFFGVILISTQGRIFRMDFADPLGSALAVSTSIIWAFYWILNMQDKRPAERKLLLNFLIGTIATTCYALIRGKLNISGLFISESAIFPGLAGALYIGIFEMGFTFILWQRALERSANTAAISNLIFFTPFISLFFISLILKESIHPATLIGLMVIVGSNFWQKFKTRTSAQIKKT